MTRLENDTLESIRQGLHAILEMGNLDEGVKKVVRKLLGLLEDESLMPEDLVKSLEKMLRRGPTTPEAAAMHLTQQIRASAGRRRRPLGRPAGRGAPREESGDPRLRAVADQLMDKVRKAKGRRPGGY